MNLFFLDRDPQKNAQFHCDKHVVKMILELTQMLYTTHHTIGTLLPNGAYKKVSVNHPTVIWVRSCLENYNYTTKLALCLSTEYTYRYNKIHKCEEHLKWLSINIPTIFKEPLWNTKTKFGFDKVLKNVPLAMPEDSMTFYLITSYRRYYILHKSSFAKWTGRPVPWWFIKNII